MSDAAHWFGDDLQWSATGDLLMADGLDQSNQRIVRRLNTIEGEYCWHPEYGASLPIRVGLPAGALGDEEADNALDAVSGVVRNQMFLEASVARTPEPTITLSPILNGAFAKIRYTDALSNEAASLDFDVEL